MKYKAPALEKGLEILEYLSTRSEPATQKEIAEAIGRNSNEIYRMLMCLDERGYILRDPVNGQYGLTLKLYSLSHGPSPIEKLREVAKPIMRELSGFANQASHITVFYEDKLMIVAPTLSPGPISVAMEEGRTYPLLATTSGRSLLAQCRPEERLNRLNALEEYTGLDQTEKEALRRSLEEINAKGYILRQSTLTQGVTDIAVIIGSDDSPLKASLSLCCIHSELNKLLTMKELVNATKDAAKKIAKNTGSRRDYP